MAIDAFDATIYHAIYHPWGLGLFWTRSLFDSSSSQSLPDCYSLHPGLHYTNHCAPATIISYVNIYAYNIAIKRGLIKHSPLTGVSRGFGLWVWLPSFVWKEEARRILLVRLGLSKHWALSVCSCIYWCGFMHVSLVGSKRGWDGEWSWDGVAWHARGGYIVEGGWQVCV